MELRHAGSRLRTRSAILRGRENQPQVKRREESSPLCFVCFLKEGDYFFCKLILRTFLKVLLEPFVVVT